MTDFLAIDPFALRQWEADHTGTRFTIKPEEFVAKVTAHYENEKMLHDGYAPFCKHIILPNFTDAKVGAVEITDDNRHLLRSGYLARTEKELPVLCRWLDAKDIDIPVAKYLDVILYSYDQVVKENQSMGITTGYKAEWGIVSIKAQNEPFETPMQPITILRNAIGKEHGGSGVPINNEEYKKSADYWQTHAILQ
eukprot:TRINITY_DN42520_c0_g1_i1.p1 TRINITY_DN42520_c0_g1~~TRINITY_DN42520_c0_g1_i1.p1  ORF type:complete len:195 (+),score=39.33 TRINITY_DN42520_c0_g1_i1:3-587(+)